MQNYKRNCLQADINCENSNPLKRQTHAHSSQIPANKFHLFRIEIQLNEIIAFVHIHTGICVYGVSCNEVDIAFGK